jgi:hypothetical protein
LGAEDELLLEFKTHRIIATRKAKTKKKARRAWTAEPKGGFFTMFELFSATFASVKRLG